MKPKLTLYFDSILDKVDLSIFTGDEPLIYHEQCRDAKEELPPLITRARVCSV